VVVSEDAGETVLQDPASIMGPKQDLQAICQYRLEVACSQENRFTVLPFSGSSASCRPISRTGRPWDIKCEMEGNLLLLSSYRTHIAVNPLKHTGYCMYHLTLE
jgi:hypothetical protein